MKIACTLPMVPGGNITEVAVALKKWGFEGVSLFVESKLWTKDTMEEVKELYNRTGINPCEFVLLSPVYGHLMDSNRNVQAQAIKLYERSIEISGELGVPTELEFEYRSRQPLPLFNPYLEMPTETMKRFVDILRRLSDKAKSCQGTLLLEPCNRYETHYVTRLKDGRSLILDASTENIGILADFFHMAIEESDIAESIHQNGDMIRHVHLADSNRLLPGYGHTDFPSAFRALKSTGFRGYMSLECGIPGSPEVELPKCVKYLRECMSQDDTQIPK